MTSRALIFACTIASLVPVSVASAETPGVPKDVLKQFEFFVGKWTAEGATEGRNAEATFEFDWVPGKHMLIFHSSWSDTEVKSLGSGIFGWDAAEKRIHTSEFWDNNVYHHRHYTIKSEEVWEGEQFSGVSRDGKPLRHKAKVEIVSPDQFNFISYDWVSDGVSQEGETTLVFLRKRWRAAGSERD